MKVIWNPLAIISYYQIVDYLVKEWKKKVVNEFRQKVEVVLEIIKKNPNAFKRSFRYENVRKAVLNKQNSLYYKVTNSEIELLFFWDNRQDSKKLKY